MLASIVRSLVRAPALSLIRSNFIGILRRGKHLHVKSSCRICRRRSPEAGRGSHRAAQIASSEAREKAEIGEEAAGAKVGEEGGQTGQVEASAASE